MCTQVLIKLNIWCTSKDMKENSYKINPKTGEVIEEETLNVSDEYNERIEILSEYAQNEEYKGCTSYDDGKYLVEIHRILYKVSSNGNPYIEFALKTIGKEKEDTIYARYYMSDKASKRSICALRNLLYEFEISDFTKEEIIDDELIIKKLKQLLNRKCILILLTENEFQNSRLVKFNE